MTYLPLKRGREEEIIHNITTMANYLIHFSKATDHHDSFDPKRSNNSPGRFECRTCNRQFTSFQALGGHRASHKRPRLMGGGVGGGGDLTNHQAKSKSHECSICGLEFAVGQALGGHMRRHRAAAISESHLSSPLQQVEGAKKVNDHEIRVFGVDLNLTPLENDLELGIRKVAPNLVELCL